MNYMDQPTGVRKGEELDKERVAAFLKDAIPGLSGDLSIRQFPGGYSNLTYMLSYGRPGICTAPPPLWHQGQVRPRYVQGIQDPSSAETGLSLLP